MKKEIKELLDAIFSNTEMVNMPTPDGRDNYVPMVRIQYIADELEELGYRGCNHEPKHYGGLCNECYDAKHQDHDKDENGFCCGRV